MKNAFSKTRTTARPRKSVKGLPGLGSDEGVPLLVAREETTSSRSAAAYLPPAGNQTASSSALPPGATLFTGEEIVKSTTCYVAL